MTWGRMDDKFHRSRKVRALRRTKAGRLALGAWVFWWSWCLDDPALEGTIHLEDLDESDRKSAQLLVTLQLWTEIPGGFRIHDFHDYNPTRAQREAKLEADRNRQESKRKGIPESVARDSVATPLRLSSDSEASRERVASTRVPNPSKPREERETRAQAKHMSRFYDSLGVGANNPRHAWAAKQFSDARKAGGGGSWTWDGKNHGAGFEALTKLLRSIGAEDGEDETFADAMRGFMADPNAKSAGYPISFLAHDYGGYVARGKAAKASSSPHEAEVSSLTSEYHRLRKDAAKALQGGNKEERTRLSREADAIARKIKALEAPREASA